MKHLLALRQAKQEKLDKMNALLSSVTSENRSLNKEEQSTINTFKTEVRNLNSQIEAAELVVDEERSLITGTKDEKRTKEPSNAFVTYKSKNLNTRTTYVGAMVKIRWSVGAYT